MFAWATRPDPVGGAGFDACMLRVSVCLLVAYTPCSFVREMWWLSGSQIWNGVKRVYELCYGFFRREGVVWRYGMAKSAARPGTGVHAGSWSGAWLFCLSAVCACGSAWMETGNSWSVMLFSRSFCCWRLSAKVSWGYENVWCSRTCRSGDSVCW